jgi:hypothetical protein|tara:strand:+ start:1904 stop:2332 length:429 start_codon:yes stop_codon:yes gene_type:complete
LGCFYLGEEIEMANLIKIITFMLCINIMLYLGGFQLIEGDILNKFFEIEGNSIKGLNSTFNEDIPTTPQIAGIDTTTSDFRITDIPKTLLRLFRFMLNIMLAPIAIFGSPQLNLPFIFQMMIGVPITIIFIIIIVDWWRGND